MFRVRLSRGPLKEAAECIDLKENLNLKQI